VNLKQQAAIAAAAAAWAEARTRRLKADRLKRDAEARGGASRHPANPATNAYDIARLMRHQAKTAETAALRALFNLVKPRPVTLNAEVDEVVDVGVVLIDGGGK